MIYYKTRFTFKIFEMQSRLLTRFIGANKFKFWDTETEIIFLSITLTMMEEIADAEERADRCEQRSNNERKKRGETHAEMRSLEATFLGRVLVSLRIKRATPSIEFARSIDARARKHDALKATLRVI